MQKKEAGVSNDCENWFQPFLRFNNVKVTKEVAIMEVNYVSTLLEIQQCGYVSDSEALRAIMFQPFLRFNRVQCEIHVRIEVRRSFNPS